MGTTGGTSTSKTACRPPYTEGYALPEASTAQDGAYFRLNYASNTRLPARLYKFSVVKNRWVFVEVDRRSVYSSLKPSLRKVLESPTSQSIRDNV